MYNSEKIKKIILISAISIILIILTIYGIGYYKKISKESNKISEELTFNDIKEESKEKQEEIVNNNLMVEIKGEVKKPNTYKVNKDTRVIDQTTPIMIQRLSHLFARKPLFLMEI